MRRGLAIAAAIMLGAAFAPGGEPVHCDVLVYGATPAGVAAAVNAARTGARVALLQPDGHIGGLVSGGLSNPDFQSFEALGGTWREFMHRVEQHYARTYGVNSAQVTDSVRGAYSEPRVARLVFESMLAGERTLRTHLHHRLARAESDPAEGGRHRLRRATFADLRSGGEVTFAAEVFIDATYEGDLMALAGATYRVGEEARSEYGESLAPAEPSPYVMTYNFRVCLTTDPDNFIPLPRPPGYDRAAYAPLLPLIADGRIKSLCNPGPPPAILRVRPIPNRKADWNDDGASPISLSLKNVNHPWPEGSPEVRARIFETYRNHSLGLFWFLAHDPEVPAAFRAEMNRWGLPRDEYPDTGNWTPALYVREGRRLVGEYVFTERDTQPAPGSVRAPVQPDSVAIGDYSLNSHGVHSPAFGVNVGRFGKVIRPYQIPYGVMLPRNVDGLLVPVAVSASHVGFSALRMEPCWVGLGQAAGLAAALAVERRNAPRAVPVPALQQRLWARGAMTVYVTDLTPVVRIPRPSWDPPRDFPAALHPWPVRSPWFRAAQHFGTQGGFRDLVDPATAPDRPRPGATGQWRGTYPHHAMGADLPIDRATARAWRERSGAAPVAELEPDGRITRGEWLGRLHARSGPAATADEIRHLIGDAGNAAGEDARLASLRRLEALPGLDGVLRRDVQTMLREIERFAHGPSLAYFSRRLRDSEAGRGSGMDYDFGLAAGSPLEPLTWLYRGRMLVWMVLESPRGRERELFDRARGFFTRAQEAFPENPIPAMYLGQALPAPRRYPAPSGAPAWARHQREAVERLTDIIEWWIERRMLADGQFGGGWGDDCEMWRWWTPVLLGFEHSAVNAAQARFSRALLGQPHLKDGYTSIMNDVEHTAEDTADTITPMIHLDPDNPEWRDRALRLIELMETRWTGRNARGHLQFRATFFNVAGVDPAPARACDTTFHARVIQPALLYWQRTADSRVGRTVTAWMETWVDAAMRAERGKPAGVLPSAIRWPDGAVGGVGESWWDPRNYEVPTLYQYPMAMGLVLQTQLLSWHMTGDAKFLAPIRAMAALRLRFLRGELAPAVPGNEAWCAERMELAGVLEKYRHLSGSTEFDALLALERHRSADGLPSDEALAATARALATNFEGYTSEVRFTDRVLRFPRLFAANGIHPEALEGFASPDITLLYSTITGDPGEPLYLPLNAVRWLTPPRDLAVRVTDRGRDRLAAGLYHFGPEPRSMAAEFYLLAPGDYAWELRAGADRVAAGDFPVTGQRTRLALRVPPRVACTLEVRRVR